MPDGEISNRKTPNHVGQSPAAGVARRRPAGDKPLMILNKAAGLIDIAVPNNYVILQLATEGPFNLAIVHPRLPSPAA
jgi:hypothetical protein